MKKKKIIILIICISAFLAIGGFMTYAINVKIEYNYNLTVDAPRISSRCDGNSLEISYASDIDTPSTIDIVLPISTKINNLEPTHISNYYNIYTNLGISSSYILTSIPDNYYIYANNIFYINKTNVLYQNEYIDSYDSLVQANYSSYYNNLFDYLNNKNKLYRARYIMVDDIKIEDDYTITRPISLDILANCNLSLNGNLIINNFNSGNYYLNNWGKINSSTSNIILNHQKNNYEIKDNIKAYVIVNEDLNANDAKNFILNYIPSYITNEIYLPKYYMSSKISFKYEIGSDDVKEEFNGIVSSSRKTKLFITISDGQEEYIVSKDVILGDSDESLLNILKLKLSSNNLFKDYDLLKLLTSLGIKRDIEITLGDNAYLVYNEINSLSSIRLTYNDGYYYENKQVNGLTIRRGLSSSNNFDLTIGSLSSSIYLGDISLEEKVSYLKEYFHTYVVTKNNLPYDIIYQIDNKTYLGNNIIYDGILFDNLNYKIIDAKGIDFTDYKVANGAITFNQPDNEFDKLYLVYFNDNDELFRIDIRRSLNGSSGESSDFESNNPFDILFTDDTNWLKTNTFIMPASYSDFYANISIISINGEAYNYDNYLGQKTVRGVTYSNIKLHNMIYISKNKVYGTSNYAKEININIDPNYIPDSNSVVAIRCELYNLGAGEVTAVHNYTLTIPGILKCGREALDGYFPNIFVDNTFYDAIIAHLKNNNEVDYYKDVDDKSYLLANIRYLTNFNLGIKSDTEIDISGIETLTNTNSIVLDNINIKSLSPFKYYNSDELEVLSLKNCQIDKSKLYDDSSCLYSLSVISLDLSYNNLSAVTSFKHMFFRTVETLNLDNTGLKTISGISDVINLKVLYLRNNEIENFEALKYLKNISTVYLENNASSSIYYGNEGLANLCVYYWVFKTYKANIYITNDTIFSLTNYEKIENMILALNAFVLPTRISNGEHDRISKIIFGYNVDGITFSIESFINGKILVKAVSGDLTCYREFYYEEA